MPNIFLKFHEIHWNAFAYFVEIPTDVQLQKAQQNMIFKFY